MGRAGVFDAIHAMAEAGQLHLTRQRVLDAIDMLSAIGDCCSCFLVLAGSRKEECARS